MRWPWSRRVEKRESGPYSAAIVNAIVEAASGRSVGDPGAIAALEAACALYAAAFAGARVMPESAASILRPSIRAHLARHLIRGGECLHLVDVVDGHVMLSPIGSWDVRGSPDPMSWSYRVDQFGPTLQSTRIVPAAMVLHCRYAVDPARPWHGIGPLGWARQTGALAANLELRLGEEAGGAVGHVLPIPQDGGDGGDDDPLKQFKQDLRNAKGRTILAETTSAGHGEGRGAAPQSDYVTRRFGADPPASLPTLRSDAAIAVLGACGVPPGLAATADGTLVRAAWQQFLAAKVEPLLAVVSDEIEAKLDVRPTWDLAPLLADLAMRAQALERMVKAKIPLGEARALAGLM